MVNGFFSLLNSLKPKFGLPAIGACESIPRRPLNPLFFLPAVNSASRPRFLFEQLFLLYFPSWRLRLVWTFFRKARLAPGKQPWFSVKKKKLSSGIIQFTAIKTNDGDNIRVELILTHFCIVLGDEFQSIPDNPFQICLKSICLFPFLILFVLNCSRPQPFLNKDSNKKDQPDFTQNWSWTMTSQFYRKDNPVQIPSRSIKAWMPCKTGRLITVQMPKD